MDFQKEFKGKRLAPVNSILATNLEFILNQLQKQVGRVLFKTSIKNVLLFFYNKNNSSPPIKIPEGFNLVAIDYGKEVKGNFITLD
jgi:hypothetical protein